MINTKVVLNKTVAHRLILRRDTCYFSFEDQGTAAVWIEAGGVSSYLGQSCCLLVLPRSSELDDFEGCFLEGHCSYFEGWCSEAALDRVEVQGQITGSWVRDYWQDWGCNKSKC